jgi:glycosyltransferase involved in cell wall biosynthesis
MPSGSRVVIAGCARDCALHLPAVLANVVRAAELFSDAAFIFVENDSRDQTLSILDSFARDHTRAQVDRATGLAVAVGPRTERLAIARNRYLDWIIASDLRSFDYLVVLDMDDINADPWDPRALERAIDFLNSNTGHAGVFANQPNLYYDMWALRHARLCPGDIWEEVLNYAMNHSVSDGAAFGATFAKRLFRVTEDAQPLEVDSAFGGLGIYRLSAVLEHSYSGTRQLRLPYRDQTVRFDCEVCEHVSLHSAIRRVSGRLFILPWLVNSRRPAAGFNPSFYRSVFRPQRVFG